MEYKLRISGKHFGQLKSILYPGDNKESGAIALCGRYTNSKNTIMLVQQVHRIPSEAYISRKIDFLEWDKGAIISIINEAAKKDLSIIKFHSHPGGLSKFSEIDDSTDKQMLKEWQILFDRNTPHGSVIMLPTDKLFGRILNETASFVSLSSIAVAGDHCKYWFNDNKELEISEVDLRNAQTFGNGTTSIFKKLKVGVVGCSGTGSIVVEQLARLGIGHLVLVDPDRIEEKNLNRILNSTFEDAEKSRYKVDVLSEIIQKIGFDTKVTKFAENLISSKPVKEIASCDVIFGCVDGAEGRHYLNRISSYYIIPYFDVGIDLQADGEGGISQITGVVHYIQPGGSSLLSRGVYSLEELESEAMYRSNFELYKERIKQNYIAGVNVDSPAVISINMHYASLLVLEFLARIHQYRITDDADLAVQQYNLEDIDNIYLSNDGEPCVALKTKVGRGDVIPLLDMPGIR